MYVAFGILDFSSLLMYEFQYKYIGTKYDTNNLLTLINVRSLK